MYRKNSRELLATDYVLAQLFPNHQIDYCCNNHCTIEDAALKKQIDVPTLLPEIQNLNTPGIHEAEDFNSFPLDALTTYIIHKHHRYALEKIPEIKQYLNTLCSAYGDTHPTLFAINNQFCKAAGELCVHMKEEEQTIFPAIRKMVLIKQSGARLSLFHFGSVLPPLQMMRSAHALEYKRLQEIKSLTNGYALPQGACQTYQITLLALRQFEANFEHYIQLENNILFPKAEALRDCLF